MAITAGLESPPIGVITTPGTKRPKYVSELAARYHRPFNERRTKAAGNYRAIPANVNNHHFFTRATQFGPEL
jgi:hypothetical protein